MNILHITTIDMGGAYKAVERLDKCLNLSGFDSKILLRTKNDDVSNGYVYLDNAVKKFASKVKNLGNLFLKKGEIERDLFGSDISKSNFVKEADVICIHWINSFLSYKTIESLFRLNKPVVFFMHDMWLFTGGCHVDLGCGKYVSGCGTCPIIESNNAKDITFKNYKDKTALFNKYKINIAGPSNWIVNCAKNSEVLKNQNINCLHNCYDDAVFFKSDRNQIIDTDKTVLLFGAAHDGTANRNKGFQYLMDALAYLDKDKYFLLVFGNADEKQFENIGFEYKLLGYVSGDEKLAEVYRAADIYITPSLQESFGYTVCEAMACGTPVVAFPVGGICDQIIHKENGYLAKLRDSEDLALGIDFVREHKTELGEAAAVSAKCFSFTKMKDIYREFFKSII